MELRSYIEALASAQPTPGGGSASAVSGILGISLMEMAIRLTKDKKAYAEHVALYERALQTWQTQRTALEDIMDKDAEAFTRVMELYRVKPSEEEAAVHARRLEDAFLYAGEVPLAGANVLVTALAVAFEVHQHVNPWVVSDLIGGIELTMGALRSILLNTAINVDSMQPTEARQVLQQSMQETLAEGTRLYEALVTGLYSNSTFKALR